MFDLIEKYRTWIKVLIGLIVIPFAFFGLEAYMRDGGRAGDVAEVEGMSITQREFAEELRQQQERLRGMFGQSFDIAQLDTPEARRLLLDGLIAQRLVAHQALKADLTVSDQTLRDVIAGMPAFQSGGQFSKSAYEAILRAQNPPLTPGQFEARMRYELTLGQLARAITETAIPSRTVAERLVALAEEQREVALSLVPLQPFVSQVKLEEAQLKSYYDANPGEFRIPERVRAEYLVLSAAELGRAEPVTEAEIKAAYEARSSEYRVDEQRRASHILIQSDPEAKEEVRQAARRKAEEILAEVKKTPARFGELAKKHSEDPGSAEKGGDLGIFGRGMMVKPFEDAVFSLKEGDISGVVQTEFGFHIIRVTGVQPGKARPIGEVRKELMLMLAQEKGQRRFAEAAEVFTNLVFEQADSLKPAAEQLKLTPRTTGWVAKTPSEALGPLNHPKMLDALFSTDAIRNKRNTDAIEVAPGTLVAARVIEHQEAKQRSFADAKADIEQKLRRREAAALATKEGEAKLAQLRKSGDAGLKWTSSLLVTRRDPGELTAELQRKVMSADEGNLPAFVGGLRGEDGYVLVRIAKVIRVEEKNEVLRAAELARIARQTGSAQYDAYIEGLRARADVTINRKALEERPQ